MVPNVVGAKHHCYDVWFGLGEPARKLISGDDSCGEETTVSVILTVVGETASLRGESPDEIGVLDTCGLELLPENCTPASLEED